MSAEYLHKKETDSPTRTPDNDSTESAVHQSESLPLQLQRMVGNQAVQRMLADGSLSLASGGVIQAKMTVGAPDDQYEQEADDVAHQVMTMPDPLQRAEVDEDMEEEAIAAKSLQRAEVDEDMEEEMIAAKSLQRAEVDEEAEEEMIAEKSLQRAGGSPVPSVSPDMEDNIDRMRGGGQSLGGETQSFFEDRFGQDFSNVNVHTGPDSDTLNRQLESRAFTTGSDIFFRGGEYNPESSGGKELIAHELTHVVQQGGSQPKQDDESAE